MKKALVISLIVMANNALAAASVSAPKIIAQRGGEGIGRIELGVAAKNALTAYAPEFQMLEASDFTATVRSLYKDAPNETPMAVIGDFNKDGKDDAVVMGKVRDELLVLGLVSTAKGYEVKEIEREVMVGSAKDQMDPPMVDDDAETDEDESSILREPGLAKSLTVLPAGTDTGSGARNMVLKRDVVQVEVLFTNNVKTYIFDDGGFKTLDKKKLAKGK